VGHIIFLKLSKRKGNIFYCDLGDFFCGVEFFSLEGRTAASAIAANGMAAWRSGGFYALPFKSALPAAVAPNRSLEAVHFVRFICQSRFMPLIFG
jgi:hypothetical protein